MLAVTANWQTAVYLSVIASQWQQRPYEKVTPPVFQCFFEVTVPCGK